MELIFKFLLDCKIHRVTFFSKFYFFMHMHMRDHDKMSVLYVPHQKKSFAKYRRRTHSLWHFTLIPVVSSSGMTYANVVSVPIKNIIDI